MISKAHIWNFWYRAWNKTLRLCHAIYPRQVPLHPQRKKTIPLAIACMFQNEGRFLKEWIEFHRLVGTARFFLYNNCSQDDFLPVLKPYIAQGIVELFDWPLDTTTEAKQVRAQVRAYRDAIARCRHQVQWLALLDADEFLFPTQENSLPCFLDAYRSYAALSVCWQQFGTAGINALDPHRCMIEQLTRKAPTLWEGNRLVKTIVQPEYVRQCYDVHFCHLRLGYLQVDEEKRFFQGFAVPIPTVNQVRINHYWTKDEQFMRETKGKRKDGFAWQLYESRKDLLNAEEDLAILRFLPQLRQTLGFCDANTQKGL